MLSTVVSAVSFLVKSIWVLLENQNWYWLIFFPSGDNLFSAFKWFSCCFKLIHYLFYNLLRWSLNYWHQIFLLPRIHTQWHVSPILWILFLLQITKLTNWFHSLLLLFLFCLSYFQGGIQSPTMPLLDKHFITEQHA